MIIGLSISLLLGCGSGVIQTTVTPAISEVLPRTITAGTPSATLKVTGLNFSQQSVILWNGARLPTSVIDANTLSSTVGGTNIAAPTTAQLRVQNPQTNDYSEPVAVVVAEAAAVAHLTIVSSTLPNGTDGAAYTATLTASGGTPPYTWSIATGSLPTGLSLNASTGVISGAPAAIGSANFTVKVTDTASKSSSAALSISVLPAALSVTTTSVPSGTQSAAYTDALQAKGGTPPYTWSITSGSLPTGVSLSSTGSLSGTPSATGKFGFTAAVHDSAIPTQSASVALSLTIAPAALTITTTSVPSGKQSAAYPTDTLQARGGTAPYTWWVSSGSLPAGLSLSLDGTLSGTPTLSGTFNFTVAVHDTANPTQPASVALSLTVAAAPLTITTTSVPSGTQSAAYTTDTLQAKGGTAPYTWWVSSGSLPAGLSLSLDGILSGTPTVSGKFNFNVAVHDTANPTQPASVTLSLTVAPTALQITTTALPSGIEATSYKQSLLATGGTSPYTWSLTSGALPAGVTLNPTSGLISGTPTASGTFTLGVTVKDSASTQQTTSKTLQLSIAASVTPLAITSSVLPGATVNDAYSAALAAAGGKAPFTWSITSSSLPPGLSLTSSSGKITGTPTKAETMKFIAKIVDSSSPAQSATATVTLPVTSSPLSINTTSLPAGTDGTAYSGSLAATGGVPSYSWSITSGALPAGLKLASTTGAISGTPSGKGNFKFTATVTDSGNPSDNASVALSIDIDAAPVINGPGTTWYVRPDGGTRYTAVQVQGQCDGKYDAAYPGSGVNQHCAFNDVRFFWTDGSYCTYLTPGCWQWIGDGGDTYFIRGSIDSGVTYRVGQSGPNGPDYYLGQAGDPYGSGAPPPPSGSPKQHTRILGENFASCTSQTARTQLHGGYGVSAVLNMTGSSYVDVACLDITDFSQCGRSANLDACNTNFPLDDYAGSGIIWSNTSTNDTVTDVRIHGMAALGMGGSTGDGVVMTDIALIGNAGAGWNADAGDGTTGIGSLLVQNYNISWNGCVEEYPIVDALPYQDCTDDNIGGYGDGFGTATVVGPAPGWQAHFDQGVVSYNTQDGLDALHLIGYGSSMTITRTLAYGNMGQQIKVGGASGTAVNNVIFTNCNALREDIPGTPKGYNARLSDYCRAADTGIAMTVGKGSTLTFDFNTVYSSSATGIQINCNPTEGPCDSSSLVDFRNNVFIGFLNDASSGYPNGVGDYSNPIYLDVNGLNPFTNPGSIFSNNVTYHAKSSWACPAKGYKEINALCLNPELTDETWHLYGYGDAQPNPNFHVVQGSGVAIPAIPLDYTGKTRSNPPSIGAYE